MTRVMISLYRRLLNGWKIVHWQRGMVIGTYRIKIAYKDLTLDPKDYVLRSEGVCEVWTPEEIKIIGNPRLL